jgi:uncharacterized repeat protein (TIGR03803 family)
VNFTDLRECFLQFRRSFAVRLAVLFLATLTATRPALAQTETVLYSFCSLANCADGDGASGALIMDSSGNLYGETDFGGANNQGTIYELSTEGVHTVLYSFTNDNGLDVFPIGGVVRDSQGNFYGVENEGGAYYLGSVYKVSPNGTQTVLYNFGSTRYDGNSPNGSLVMDKRGNLYGTTATGGEYGFGTIYGLKPDGTETILYCFNPANGTDGATPYAGLVFDKQGNMYGATNAGGLYNQGIVFELSAEGVYTILYTFGTNSSDGKYPDWSLIIDAQGNLYGVTRSGGAFNSGTAFKLTPGTPWTETILHTFNNTTNDGADPFGTLVIDKQGNLYGATSEGGGVSNLGTVFKLSPTGTETILYDFVGGQTGDTPSGGLLGDSSGNLYGTTLYGGANSYGVIYKITP